MITPTAIAHRRDRGTPPITPSAVKLGNDPEQNLVSSAVGMALEEKRRPGLLSNRATQRRRYHDEAHDNGSRNSNSQR